jgi:hypothetical protein
VVTEGKSDRAGGSTSEVAEYYMEMGQFTVHITGKKNSKGRSANTGTKRQRFVRSKCVQIEVSGVYLLRKDPKLEIPI